MPLRLALSGAQVPLFVQVCGSTVVVVFVVASYRDAVAQSLATTSGQLTRYQKVSRISGLATVKRWLIELSPLVAEVAPTSAACLPPWAVVLMPVVPLVVQAYRLPAGLSPVSKPPFSMTESRIGVGVGRMVTVKLLEEVTVPPGVVTLIGPEAAPAGTVAVIWVYEFTV